MHRLTGHLQRADLATYQQRRQWKGQSVLRLVSVGRSVALQAHGLVESLDPDTLDGLAANLRMLDQERGHRGQCRLRPAAHRPGFEVLGIDLPALAEVVP
ncbi:hypothetical protein D3C85_756150 [compost metagenome]